MRWRIVGKESFDLEAHLPTGSTSIQGTRSPSGHFVVPCDHYKEWKQQDKHGGVPEAPPSLVITARDEGAAAYLESLPSSNPPTRTRPTADGEFDLVEEQLQSAGASSRTIDNRWNLFQHQHKGKGWSMAGMRNQYYAKSKPKSNE